MRRLTVALVVRIIDDKSLQVLGTTVQKTRQPDFIQILDSTVGSKYQDKFYRKKRVVQLKNVALYVALTNALDVVSKGWPFKVSNIRLPSLSLKRMIMGTC